MFQLIVAVISIALVAILAIASIYYGGAAFLSSSTKASVTTLVNGGQQIAGANALYKTNNSGNDVTDLTDLTPPTGDYLNQLPALSGAATGAWAMDTITAGTDVRAVVKVNASDDAGKIAICNEAAKQAGQAAVTALPTDTTLSGQFGCYALAVDPDGTGALAIGDVVFGFKL